MTYSCVISNHVADKKIFLVKLGLKFKNTSDLAISLPLNSAVLCILSSVLADITWWNDGSGREDG